VSISVAHARACVRRDARLDARLERARAEGWPGIRSNWSNASGINPSPWVAGA
jgi:hypothetical protein